MSDERPDVLAVEEPLEIRAAGPGQVPVRVAVTMRTPGHDHELAAGFIRTEGLVVGGGITGVGQSDDPRVSRDNVVVVHTRGPFELGRAERNFFATSSCGICGKGALEAIRIDCPALHPDAGPTLAHDVLVGLPEALREGQSIFEQTGGLHAAGLFSLSGELRVLREDVGRHNAVDKIVGTRELNDDVAGEVLLVSGRLSFEIVQKAAIAAIPILCAISAPSSLAVDAARELGLTTVGFLRPGGFNVYTHPQRIAGVV